MRRLIDENPALQEALISGYANLSAVARYLLPRVATALGNEVKLAAVLTALKRLREVYRNPPSRVVEVVAGSTLTVKTDVAKVSLERRRRSMEVVRRLLADFEEAFIQISASLDIITLVFDARVFDEVRERVAKLDILEVASDLAAIIIHSPEVIVNTAGCAATFYTRLYRHRINIEDTVSCYTDTIIVVKMEDVGRAFRALTDLINTYRELLKAQLR